ncbi:MAG: hypothetical protein R2879_07835 [Saprospiraceae bacterium]
MKNSSTKTLYNPISFLKQKGFRKVNFEGNAFTYISTFDSGHSISFKIFKKDGLTTLYKPSSGGAIIVFEVNENGEFEGYCPIFLFGIWNLKLSFKKNAMWPFLYRKEGFEIREAMQQIANKNSTRFTLD